MSYHQPIGSEPYWPSHESSAPETSLRHPLSNLTPTTDFDVVDFQPFNGVSHQRQQPHSTGSEGYQYDPQFQRPSVAQSHGYQWLEDKAIPTFDQGQGWAQASPHCPPEKLPEYRPIFSEPAVANSAPPQAGQTYPGHSAVPQPAKTRPSHQQASGVPWRVETLLPRPHENPQDSHSSPRPTRPQDQSQAGASTKTEPAMDCSVAEQAQPPRQDQSPGPPPNIHVNNPGKDKATAIVRPVTEPPAKQKPNGTNELIGEAPSKRKATKSNTTLKKPRVMPGNLGDSYYCEVCNLVCSGPLNLRMHISGTKHKLNDRKALKEEATGVRKTTDGKLRGGFAKAGPIPNDHDQEVTPLVGLDFVTRVVIPDREEGKDLFECSLCDEEGVEASSIYGHMMGTTHRIAYIRKVKPDLADQYANISNVYEKTGQLQRRQASDLPALLTNLVKIAARRDGPGEMQIRLCNEREEEEEGAEDGEDYGVEGYNSDTDDFDEMPSEEEEEGCLGDDRSRPLQTEEPSGHHQVTSALRASHNRPDHQPTTNLMPARPQRVTSDPTSPATRPQPRGASPDTPVVPASPGTLPPRRASSPGRDPSRVPPLPSSRPPPGAAPSMMRLAPPSSSAPPAPSNKPAPPPPAVTRHPPNLPPASEATTQRPSKTAPADLPALTDDQLRCYCSDVFIAQEYRRRFGDPVPPASTSRSSSTEESLEQTSSIATAKSNGSSVEALLKSLSDTTVHNEDEASMAMKLTRALTQATLKFRLREKNFALQ